jgi:peptidoglycan-N-acetylglucosamine deacetylase
MKKTAYVTIDDGPSEDTHANVDFLVENGIPAVMFFSGDAIDRFPAEALRAAKAGIIIGNHSTSHPYFSKLRFDQAVNEIQGQDDRIEALYEKAGIPRPAKVFRFPYGDKGGDDKDAIQDFLRTSGYQRLKDGKVRRRDFLGKRLGVDYDLTWTYDACDYKFLGPDSGWTKESYVGRLSEMIFKAKAGFGAPSSEEVILMHDIPAINANLPGYFRFFLGLLKERGVSFKRPVFA